MPNIQLLLKRLKEQRRANSPIRKSMISKRGKVNKKKRMTSASYSSLCEA